MGGLGKTTLAQLIYNDERTKQHFDLRIWVCVSDDFGIKRLVKGMLEYIDGVECNISGLDLLVHRLRERLSGKKILIILDDVWNEDYRLWDEMRKILRCNSRGSTLVVTTRIQQIASMMAKSNVHHIGCLRKEDSWSLFKQIAFSTGEADERLLSDIGKAMVEKCKGVPLAIKALGGLMQSKSEIDEWLVIKESKLWDVLDDENGVSHVLKLSYYNLPPHMRQCFAYSCVFPKDHEMEVDQLIQLWMANGFIPWDGQGDLLTSARSIFKGLVSRSFFQCSIKNDLNDIKVCKMHDLLHDLATSVMRGEICILEHGNKLEVPRRIRHIFFDQSFDQIEKLACHSLRSFLMWNQGYETSPRASVEANAITSFLLNQKYLRAMDMSFYSAAKLGFSSSKLKHLKYIVLQCRGLTRLPESLTHLSNLQTLRLMYSSELQELHKDLKVMKNLSFLEIQNSDSLLCTPPGLGELRCLRKFPIFIVGQDVAQRIKEMKELNLEGRLIIKGLENVRSFEDAKSSNLVAKRNLTSLRLCWTKDDGEMLPQQFEEVLQGLEPHHNLEKLFIEHYCGSKLPNWMGSSTFYKLEHIALVQCRRCEHLPPLGNLPSLRRLSLWNMDSIWTLGEECLGDGECSFPALKVLEISSMSNLEEWIIPYSTKCFPCLICMCILGCPKLSKLPFLPSLRKLQMWDSNAAVLTSIKNLISLESFSLDCLDEVDVLPDDLLQNSKAALEELVIQATCIRTVSKVLDNLSSLKELTFNGCLKLEDLPNECFSGLHSLEKLKPCWKDCLPLHPYLLNIVRNCSLCQDPLMELHPCIIWIYMGYLSSIACQKAYNN